MSTFNQDGYDKVHVVNGKIFDPKRAKLVCSGDDGGDRMTARTIYFIRKRFYKKWFYIDRTGDYFSCGELPSDLAADIIARHDLELYLKYFKVKYH